MKLSLLLLATFFLSQIAAAESSLETVPADEKETTIELIKKVEANNKTEHRDQHPKPHGCVDGATLIVDWENPTIKLPNGETKKIDIGAFEKKGARYDVKIRFSSGSPSRKAADPAGGAQGMALKLQLQSDLRKRVVPFNEKKYGFPEIFFLEPEEYYKTFDIITIAGGENKAPVREFFTDTAKDYDDFFAFQDAAKAAVKEIIGEAVKAGKNPKTDLEVRKAIGAATVKALKEHFILKDPKKPRLAAAAILERLGKTVTGDLLVKEFNSFLPSHYGKDETGKDQAIKYLLEPVKKVSEKAPLVAPKGVDITRDNYLTDWLKFHLAEEETKYELKIQFHAKNFSSVELGTAEWPVKDSPYVKIATLTIPQKNVGKEFMDETVCETMAFNPAHSTEEHLPTGGSQRVRSPIYVKDANLRNENAGRKPYQKQ